MKKMLSVALSAIMAASLMACGGGSAKGTETKAAQTEAGSEAKGAAETEKAGEKTDAGDAVSLEGKTVGFAQTDSMSAWRTTETDSIKKAVEEAGGKLVVKDAAKVDYLVVAPLENNGLQSALEEAMEAKIPVILVDRAIDGEAGKYFTTSIRSDFVWEGEQCAKALETALPDGGNVVIINGGYDSSTSTDRQDGFVKTLDSSKFKVVAEQDGQWLMDKAQAVMENILQAQGGENINAVYCVTDDMAQGAMKAIEAAGLTPGKDILILGIDGTKAAFKDIEAGRQLASCTCSPYFGPIVVETIGKIAKGDTVPENITNEDTLYTKENVQVDLGF